MPRIDFHLLEKAGSSLAKTLFDPAAWPEVMDEICLAAGTTGAVLLQADARTNDVPRTQSADEMVRFYFKHDWHTKDLRAHGLGTLLRGENVFIDEDFTSPEEMRHHSYYNDFLYRTGFAWFAGVGFRAESALWVLAMQRTRDEGIFDSEDKRILGTLSRKLTETATLSKAVGQLAVSSMINALTLVDKPALIVDRMGYVIDTNAGADSLFDDNIRVRNRRIIVRNKLAAADFDVLSSRLRVTADTEALPIDPILVRREAKPPILIRVLPISGPARSVFVGARALLTLTELSVRSGPDPFAISRAFGLSQAEARVASLIAGGFSPEEAAKRLGISVITARNQLKAAFAKTDTHRQSELVALLARL